MAQFNPNLQTQPSPVAASTTPSAGTAIAGAVSSGLSTLSNILTTNKQIELQQQRIDAAAAKDARDVELELLTSDVGLNLSEGYQARSGSPNQAKEWLNAQVREIRQKHGSTVAGEALKFFEERTGVNPYRSRSEIQKERTLLDQQVEAEAQQNAQFYQAAVRYRDAYAGSDRLFTPDGQVKEGVTDEQVIAFGRNVVVQQQARLANLETEASLATKESEIVAANSKKGEVVVAQELTAEIRTFAQGLEGLTPQEAVARLDEHYNTAVLQIQESDLLQANKKNIKDSLDIAYNTLRDGISGRQGVLTTEYLNGIRAARDFQNAIEADPQTRAVYTLNKAGIRPSEAGVKAAEVAIAKQVRTNPHSVTQADGNVEVDSDGNVTLDNGNKISFQRMVTDTYLDDITLVGKPSTDPIPELGGKSQADIISDRIVVGLTPATAEQKAKFYSRDGIYVRMLRDVWGNKENVENYTPAILNKPDVRERFVVSNGDALTRTLSSDMAVIRDIAGDEDVLEISMEKGYPQFRSKRRGQGVEGPVDFAQSQTNKIQARINNMNLLLKLQYEAAVNYSDVIADNGQLVNDTVSQQINSLSEFILTDSNLANLTASSR